MLKNRLTFFNYKLWVKRFLYSLKRFFFFKLISIYFENESINVCKQSRSFDDCTTCVNSINSLLFVIHKIKI